MPIPWNSEEIERIKDYFRVSERDLELLRELLPLATRLRNPFVNGLYRHFHHFPETASFFPDDEILARAKAGQGDFYMKLFSTDVDEDYLSYLWKVGELHDQLGLEPLWYMGCYAYYFSRLFPALVQRAGNRPGETLEESLQAVTNMACLSIAVVWTAYYKAREAARGPGS